MSDRRGDEADDEIVVDFREEAVDEDRLPWLEAVEEDGEGGGPGIAKLLGAVVIGLIAIGLIVGGLFWLGNRNGGGGGGNGEVIAAPDGDYKVRPTDPGGMNVAGEGDTAYAASEGQQPQGQLNANALAETPVARPAPQQPATPAQAPRPQTPAPQPQQPAAPAGGGATIQLGAFSSGGSANSAWTALAGRFRYLAPLSHSVVTAQVGGRTYYRLRASGPGAADICRRLRVAGEDCSVVG